VVALSERMVANTPFPIGVLHLAERISNALECLAATTDPRDLNSVVACQAKRERQNLFLLRIAPY